LASQSADNRRAAARAQVDVLANRFLGGYPYLCQVKDISRNGLRLHRLHEPERNFRFVGLQFLVPGSEEVVTASAEVVFSDPGTGDVGLRFTQMSAAGAAAIERFVSGAAGAA
jgi:hypothetical protein